MPPARERVPPDKPVARPAGGSRRYTSRRSSPGMSRKSMVLSQAERRVVAVHEAGHAMIYLQTRLLPPLHKVSIIPRGQAPSSHTNSSWHLSSQEGPLVSPAGSAGGRSRCATVGVWVRPRRYRCGSTTASDRSLMRTSGEVDHPAGDIDSVVAETLVKARHQRQLHRHRKCYLS